jgi:hypothetical protein
MSIFYFIYIFPQWPNFLEDLAEKLELATLVTIGTAVSEPLKGAFS